jgi:hypothetical protein
MLFFLQCMFLVPFPKVFSMMLRMCRIIFWFSVIFLVYVLFFTLVTCHFGNYSFILCFVLFSFFLHFTCVHLTFAFLMSISLAILCCCFSFLYSFIHICIHWAISPPTTSTPSSSPITNTSSQNLFCPLLQFCWRRNKQ